MSSYDQDDVDVPWGKYTYALEGLATRCYMEGPADTEPNPPRPGAPVGQRLRFRVELPARCFVLSVVVKLPHAPLEMLPMLNDVLIERTLCNKEFEKVYDGYVANSLDRKAENCEKDVEQVESPTSVGEMAGKNGEGLDKEGAPVPRKKVMEVRRAADSLRLTVTDMDVVEEKMRGSTGRRRRSNVSDDASDSGDLQTLGIVVVGYVRGQTPAANRIKILLNSAAKVGVHDTLADRAEVDGLLGLAFLGHRRYRQAAELLQRASELIVVVAEEDAKSGISVDDALTWAAELNLLSAHAYFEHMPMSNDGIVRLVQVAATAKNFGDDEEGENRDIADLTDDFLDLRTELLNMLEGLLSVLVKFLGDSNSVAVKMASARMIEFVSEQLGCAIATHMSGILNQVLRLYPSCTAFGTREQAAASSFSYDSMEDCFERLIDICCRLFPLTEHSVLQKLFDNTLIPVFLNGYDESEYLYFDMDAEEVADEVLTTGVAQSLRVIYLVLNILGADARVPSSLVTRVLNMLVVENGNPRTPLLLRRTALHTWDAISKSLRRSAFGNTVNVFVEHIKVLRNYAPQLLGEFDRPDFEYADIDEENDAEFELVKEEYVVPGESQVLSDLLKKRHQRVKIVDRHTLGRLLSLIYDICSALEPSEEEEERYLDVSISLQEVMAQAIADLLMSSLIDVSYHEATASGNGLAEGNNLYEFGDINTQLKIASEVLEELFESYWASISLVPSSVATDIVRTAPIRAVLGWCVARMYHSAPPRGMLKLLFVAVRGLQHELNTPMYKLPAVPASPHEVTFIDIHRALIQWFPQSVYEEAFDLMDILNESVAEDLMARDLSLLVQGLGDQGEKFQSRTDASLELLATIVASRIPRRPDLAMSSLRALVDPALRKQRIANGFPKSSRSNTGSFTRRMQVSQSTPRVDPMSKSLYIHVVLASCFDKFDALGVAAKRRGGPSYMGDKIDAFVEHAALSVRCLHACARARTHREYVGAVLGDIFWTCLAMQDHGDGRVRLAGFEIFAASLDVLFHTQKALVLVPSEPNSTNNEATVLTGGSVPDAAGIVLETTNSVTELAPHWEKEAITLVSTSSFDGIDGNNLQNSNAIHKRESRTEDAEDQIEAEDEEVKMEREMQAIFADGGSCSFQMENKLPSQLEFEERGWQMLCAFVTSSLGIGKYVDFVVQRACLEYLKGCMLNALRGRSTGASVITFEHIGLLWDAVNRLVGSPWRTLNALALWVICAIVNVSLYSSIMAKGRGLTRQRTAQLNEFLVSQVFPRAEAFLKNGIRETRIWGMRLLEAYLRARDQNALVAQIVPALPRKVLRGLDNLKHDWDDEVRERSQSLLKIHFNVHHKKPNMNSFTPSFMYMKKNQNDEEDTADSSTIELWFPPLPKQMKAPEMEVYCRTLEAFANAEIEGGEETELVGMEKENEEIEGDFGEVEFEDEEEGYELDVGEVTEDEPEDGTELEIDESVEDVVAPDNEIVSDPEDFGSSESSDSSDEPLVKADSIPELDSIPQEDPVHEEECIKESGNQTSETEAAPSSNYSDPVNDDEEDKEFAHIPEKEPNEEQQTQAPSLITQVSDLEDDEFGAMPVRMGSSDDEDEEVVDVTDEEDVLMDVEPIKKGNVYSSDPLKALKDETGKGRADFPQRESVGRHDSMPSLGLKLNPDLDEKLQVLRRKGSFTSRSSAPLHIEEGDAPKLARRRSHDVASLTATFEAGIDNKLGNLDEGVVSVVSGGRLIRRKSMKSVVSPSPKSTERGSLASPRSGDAAAARNGENQEGGVVRVGSGDAQTVESTNSGLSRLSRRKSMKSVIGKVDKATEKVSLTSPRSGDSIAARNGEQQEGEVVRVGSGDGQAAESTNSGSSKLSRRKSMKSVAVKASEKSTQKSSFSSPRSGASTTARNGDFQEGEVVRASSGDGQTEEEPKSGPFRLPRRKVVVRKIDDNGKGKTSETLPESSERNSKDAVVGTAFLSLSPRGSRVARGVILDDESNDVFEVRPNASQASAGSSGDFSRSRLASEPRPTGSKPNRRSLPRAPAFLKGGGFERRMSGNQGSGGGVNQEDNKKGNVNSSGGSAGSGGGSSGSSSNPTILSTGSRSRIPRGRSQVNKSLRPEGIRLMADGNSERRLDRSHRFSKREPLALGFGEETEQFDKDLFGDLEYEFDVDLENQLRVGTPTAEALRGRVNLADDSPNSGHGRRRGANRSVFNSLHYKGLLDQISSESSDDSPRSEGPRSEGSKSSGSNASREGGNSSPSLSQRREAVEKIKSEWGGQGDGPSAG